MKLAPAALVLALAAVSAWPARADDDYKAPKTSPRKHAIKEPARRADDPEIPSSLILAGDLSEEEAVAWCASRAPELSDERIRVEVGKIYHADEGSTVTSAVFKDRSAIIVLRSDAEGRSVGSVARSKQGYPVISADALVKTVEPNGLSRGEMKRFREAVSRVLARKGTCRVLIAFDNGNAASVEFRVDKEKPLTVTYKDELVKQGTFDREDFDVVVENAESWSKTDYGPKHDCAKSILDGAEVSRVR